VVWWQIDAIILHSKETNAWSSVCASVLNKHCLLFSLEVLMPTELPNSLVDYVRTVVRATVD